jgi:hypothetical protein
MDLNYHSNLSQSPPAGSQDFANASRRLPMSPWSGYGRSHQDAMRALGAENYALYGLAAAKANNDFGLQEQQALNQLTLGGLQSMSKQRQDMRSLDNARIGLTAGLYNSLLSGLYG